MVLCLRGRKREVTTIQPVSRVCAVCGATSEHQVLGSNNAMGPPDLDLRPAPMARWTLGERIQRCPECGYCAEDISAATDSARAVVRNEAYLAESRREGYPELTRRYLCASLILSIDGEDGLAGRAALMGAWAADDLADVRLPDAFGPADDWGAALPAQPTEQEQAERRAAAVAAAHCRRLAIGFFEADRRQGLTFAVDENTADAMLADLHRRVGDFEGARICAHVGIDRGATGFVLDVFRFQLLLCDLGNNACHNVDEVGADGGLGLLLA
jgi:hypothetical protein